jgi:hypothetical protein
MRKSLQFYKQLRYSANTELFKFEGNPMAENKKRLARMTIDLSKEEHQKLKALAAILDKSLKELVLEAVNAYLKTEAVGESLLSITKGIESAKKS